MPTDSRPIEDPSEIEGEDVFDQEEIKIGKVKQVYESGGEPMWACIEASFGLGSKRTLFVPIARLKQEGDQLRIPYSKNHLAETPEVEVDGELSADDDTNLRDHFGIDRGDHEIRSDNDSYAARIPADRGSPAQASGES